MRHFQIVYVYHLNDKLTRDLFLIHITTHYFIRSIWFTEQTLSLRQNTLTGSHCQKLTFQPTTPQDFRNSAPPAAPRDPCYSPDNIGLPDIIYVYILSRCSRSRHHSFLFFLCFLCFLVFLVFGFSFLVFGLLLHIVLNFLSQAMYKLMMATTMAETCSC